MASDDWKTLPLSELMENLDSVRVPVKEADRKPGPYPYYGASGVVDHVDGYLFDGEYLLIAEDGENLRTRQTPIAFLAKGKFWVNNHAHIVRGNGRATTRFLNYALANTDVSGYLTGSTMPKLTQGNMNRIPILAPPRDVQDAIANILGVLDDKIELNRRMNETLEGLARAIFQSWFVDFDGVRRNAELKSEGGRVKSETSAISPFSLHPSQFNPLFPDSFEDSELGKIPKGWKVGRIVDCCEKSGNGGTPKRDVPDYWEPGTVPWLTSGEVRQSIVISTENFISQSGLENSSAKMWPAWTTIVALYGATAGQTCLVATELCANQACCGLIAKPHRRFFNYLLLSSSVAQLEQQARGSAQQNLSKQIVEDMPSVLPSDAVLKAFESLVAPTFDRWVANLRESQTLAAIRDALLPKLLSGEIRVAEAERLVEDAG